MSVTKNVLFQYLPGVSGITATLLQSDGATAVQSGVSCPETGTNTGWYNAPFTAAVASTLTTYKLNLIRGGSVFGGGYVDLSETAGTYELQNAPTALMNATLALSQGVVNYNPSITIPPAVAVASLTPGYIGFTRGDTLISALPLMGNIASRTKMVWTAKLASMVLVSSNTDSQSVIQISESGGLLTLNGTTATDSTLASISVTNATTGAVTLTLKPGVTSVIPIEDLVWDCQFWVGSVLSTPINGTFSITADVTQSIT